MASTCLKFIRLGPHYNVKLFFKIAPNLPLALFVRLKVDLRLYYVIFAELMMTVVKKC